MAKAIRKPDGAATETEAELLRVLMQMVKSYEHQDGEAGGAVYYACDIEDARAVIKKARGVP
jgi:L-lactate utilization protein LutB